VDDVSEDSLVLKDKFEKGKAGAAVAGATPRSPEHCLRRHLTVCADAVLLTGM